jgi:CBS domain containing-hemolysin-like protein
MSFETLFQFLLGLGAVLFLVLVNGFFVAAEFAIVKVRVTQIEAMLRQGRTMARLARDIVSKLNSYLSATQLGITLASLGLGWVGKPAVEVFIRRWFQGANLRKETADALSFAIAFSFITFLHIVVGELGPKSFAIQRAESTALAVAGPLSFFYRLSYPAIWLLERSARLFLKAFGLPPLQARDLAFTEEELRLVLSRSPEKEMTRFARNLALKALELRRRPVREIIIPRTRIIFLSTQRSLEENLALARESGFTRYPLCEESIDQVIGMVHIKDLLWRLQESPGNLDLKSLRRDIIFIPETLPLEEVLSRFLRGRTHLAFVLDEYGGTIGMVTLEDVLEELVGEIQDEFDQELPPITRLSGPAEEYLAEGFVPLYQLNSFCGVALEGGGVDTLSGFLIKKLGRIPAEGEELELDGLTFVIKKVGKRRIHQVLLRKRPEPEGHKLTRA